MSSEKQPVIQYHISLVTFLLESELHNILQLYDELYLLRKIVTKHWIPLPFLWLFLHPTPSLNFRKSPSELCE